MLTFTDSELRRLDTPEGRALLGALRAYTGDVSTRRLSTIMAEASEALVGPWRSTLEAQLAVAHYVDRAQLTRAAGLRALFALSIRQGLLDGSARP